MGIEISDKTIAIWFISFPNDSDYMAHLGQTDEPETYRITYRFRYYNSPDPFDEDDEKHWYAGETKGSEEVVLEKTRAAIKALAHFSQAELFDEIIMGDGPDALDKFFEEMKNKSWTHMRSMDMHEYIQQAKKEDGDKNFGKQN